MERTEEKRNADKILVAKLQRTSSRSCMRVRECVCMCVRVNSSDSRCGADKHLTDLRKLSETSVSMYLSTPRHIRGDQKN
jgi:hypothetical protein